jgi:energy-converting hydrogenase Eha subunit C
MIDGIHRLLCLAFLRVFLFFSCLSCALLTCHPINTVLVSANCEAVSTLIYCIVLLTDCELVVWSV